MKSLSASLAAHLQGELTQLAHLVKITRTDGVVVGVTDHDVNLLVDGTVYYAEGGMTEKMFSAQTDMKAAENTVLGVLSCASIAEEDLKAGLYDHARVDVSLCNWNDLSQGILVLQRGWLGEVVLKEGSYQATYMGLCDCLQRQIGQVYTPECRFDLGDANCGINLEVLAVHGTVSSVLSDIAITDLSRTEADDYFNYGTLTWQSGALKGFRFDVRNWDLATRTLTFWLSGAAGVRVGDSYLLSPGCDRRYTTCQNRFANIVRFGGFPHLAGLAKILQYPESS